MRRAFFLLLLLSACKKPLAEPPMAPSGPGPAPEARPIAPTPVQQIARNFERVAFPYDSAELTVAAQQALRENAALLAENPDVAVEVQGHCDERGTTEYNLALGQQRAAAVQRFLAANGVAKSRLAVVSYGEERPLQHGEGEHVWAQNRRAAFRVTGGDPEKVAGTVP
ncbi:MAG: peptidoglycan-associated lipoprotein Pal [Myxococcota bacterium]